METAVDPELEQALAGLDAALDRLFEVGVGPHDSKDAVAVIGRMERVARRVSAANVEVLAAVDRDGLYHLDGYFSAKVMVRHVAKVSNAEAAGRASTARALRDLPALGAVWARGGVGSCQVRRLGRVYANKRVRDRLIHDEHRFIAVAQEGSFKEFDLAVSDWVRLADEDGTADTAEANHENRDFRIAQEYNTGFAMRGRTGSVQGAQIEEIVRHFERAEFRADWAAAVEQHGEGNVTKDMLSRSDAQRRADAHLKALQAGACNRHGGGKTRFITNIVLDLDTFERELAKAAGADPEPVDPWNPRFESRTLNGRLINTAEATAAALIGQCRRAVINAAGVTINMSRESRLFKGSSRLAVQLMDCDCHFIACETDITDCQIDHLTPWAQQHDGTGGGATNPDNGAGACPKHNRYKSVHGYTTWRDPTGKWHTYRPDGTEIP